MAFKFRIPQKKTNEDFFNYINNVSPKGVMTQGDAQISISENNPSISIDNYVNMSPPKTPFISYISPPNSPKSLQDLSSNEPQLISNFPIKTQKNLENDERKSRKFPQESRKMPGKIFNAEESFMQKSKSTMW